MILANGVVRTMDPSLPTAAALAIAGDRIVGGVGTHETALPTPERVDLRGRCVLPAFTDSHVHFPTWSLARRDVRLEGVASLAEALARVGVATAARASGSAARGWRDARWSRAPDARRRSTRSRATRRRRCGRRTTTRSGSTPRRSPAPAATSRSHGGVVERDAAGEPTGVLREESAWRFRDRHVDGRRGRVASPRRARASGSRTRAASARSTTRTAGSARQAIFARIHERDGLTLRVWQSLPHDASATLAELRPPLAASATTTCGSAT